MPADVLFTRRQRECECAFSIYISCQTDDSSWHLSGVSLTAGKDTVDWPAGGRTDTERLAFAANNICAPVTRGLDNAELHDVYTNDECRLLPNNLLQIHQTGVKDTECTWLLYIDSATASSQGSGIHVYVAIFEVLQNPNL